MFNFKKKETPEKTIAEVAVAEKNGYPQIVNEIHNEFLTAGDKILEEANCILTEARKKSIDKGKQLAALGFTNVPEAKEAVSTEQTIVKTKELADLVEYYSVNYPNNKFITEEQVQSICEKYGLVCGSVSLYKGFVPQKNILQMQSFKIQLKDIGITKAFYDSHPYLPCVVNLPSHYMIILDRGEKIVYQDWYYRKETTMKICAPLKDMDMSEHKFIGYHVTKNIPDPVVLQNVNGGYLIVTAWGDEASDENVVNQKMN